MKNLAKWTILISLFIGSEVCMADDLLEDTDSLDQYADQSQGNYQAMNLDYAGIGSNLGMTQNAWLDPLQNLGEGQTRPAYSKYYWSPDLVLPIRVREGMITMINFPEWELIEEVLFGDTGSFNGKISGNSVILYPENGRVGVDSNVIIKGRSGNNYVFYIKSEGVNTERLTNAIIDIDIVGGNNPSGGSPSSGSGVVKSGSSSAFRDSKTADASYTRRFLKEDWLKNIPIDPTKFRFDIEIYVPNPDDVVIAPERVWRDDIFTYIDLGEKALNMIQRPIVTLIVERVETPVGFRTKGPNNRLIIVEGIGDMVMRSGKRMVCLKLRRSDEEGLQYVSYADDQNNWDIAPAIPGGKNGSSGGAVGGAAGGAAGAEAGSSVSGAGNGGAMNAGGINSSSAAGGSMNGMIPVPNYANADTAAGGGMSGVGMDGTGSAGGVAAAGVDCLPTMVECNSKRAYPKYKYGSAFIGQKGENLSIELGTDSNVNNLENLWKDLSGRYSSLLGGYEPFYSVDAPADGQGKELFHLRVGPVKSLESGDNVCSQLGRSGIFCSVVRVQ